MRVLWLSAFVLCLCFVKKEIGLFIDKLDGILTNWPAPYFLPLLIYSFTWL